MFTVPHLRDLCGLCGESWPMFAMGKRRFGAKEATVPIYEYACRKCEERFEILVRSQDQEIRCPRCGAENAEKLFSSFGTSSGATAAPPACPSRGASPT